MYFTLILVWIMLIIIALAYVEKIDWDETIIWVFPKNIDFPCVFPAENFLKENFPCFFPAL